MYNPNLITMVDALMEAPMLMIEVPKVFFQSRYNDFALWLMRERGLLALALYRSAEASQDRSSEEEIYMKCMTFSAITIRQVAR